MEHFDHVLMKKNPDHDLKKIRKITEMKADRFLAREKAEQKKTKISQKKRQAHCSLGGNRNIAGKRVLRTRNNKNKK